MNKFIILQLVILLVTINQAMAQHEVVSQDTTAGSASITIKVRGETGLENVLPVEFIYEFKEFRPAELFFLDGSKVSSKINFNLISGELLFMGANNSIMQINNPENVKFVITDDIVWIYYEKWFGKLLLNTQETAVDIVRVKKTVNSNYQIETAFSGTSNTSATKTITSVTMSNTTSSIVPVGEYTFKTDCIYYLKKGEKISFSNIRALRSLFPQSKKEINKYVQDNKINLQNEADLIKVINFFNQ